MWGSTTPNTASQCTWSNAPFNGGASDYDSDYFNSVKDTVCPNGVLAKEYDAASHNMGGDWRMPTQAEFKELYNNTNKEWTQVNHVNGWKFTSKTDTSKYIFIPAAGRCSDGSVNYVGSNGHVWSSSLNASNPDRAWYLSFGLGHYGMSDYYRYGGRSVRGVRK